MIMIILHLTLPQYTYCYALPRVEHLLVCFFECPLMVFQYQMQLTIYFTMLNERVSVLVDVCVVPVLVSVSVQCSTGLGVRMYSLYWGWAGGPQTLHLRCCNLTNELKIVGILENGNACLTI